MIRARSCLFWALLVAYIAGCIWWSQYVPYDPKRLYRAVPADVTVLTAHYNLAARWSNLASNPVTATLLGSVGLDHDTLQDLNGNPVFQTWLKRLASDEVIAAYSPSLGASRRPAWIFASWIGGRSQQLRWMVSAGSKFKPIQRQHHDVWIIRPVGAKKGPPVTLTLAEGMVVGCIGDDVTVMDDILACLDGAYPSLAARPDLMVSRDGGPDRGWYETSPGAEKISYVFQTVTADTIAGSVMMPYAIPGNSAREPAKGIEDLKKLWGDATLASMYIDRSVAVTWITNSVHFPWVGALTGLVGRTEEGTVALCLLRDEFSGRFKGIKLPTVMAGTSVDDPVKAITDIADRIDRLNARLRWGLVPQELSVEGRSVYALESTAKRTLYSKLALNEEAGYTAGSNWLLFSSNVEGLTNLLVAAARREGSMEPASDSPSAPVQGWIDLDEGGKVIRLAINDYYLKLLLEDAAGTEEERHRLTTIKAWVDAVAPLKAVRFSVQPEGDASKLMFDAGAK